MFQQRRPNPVRRSRAEWQSLVEEYEASDLSQYRFCSARGVSRSQLQYWRKRFLEEASADGRDGSPADFGFLELPSVAPRTSMPTPMPAPALPAAPAGDGDWRVELDLGGGMVLRLR